MPRSNTRKWWVFCLGLVLMGCGLAQAEDVPSGPVCSQDADCVPNACCGTGTGTVNPSDAPVCSQVTCTNGCPLDQLECGCGVPVCRTGHCTAAWTVGPGCPNPETLAKKQ